MARPDDPKPKQPDHSMREEEPLGWDQAPTEGDQPTPHRHPRRMGKGGTPDHELDLEESQASGGSDDKSARTPHKKPGEPD